MSENGFTPQEFEERVKQGIANDFRKAEQQRFGGYTESEGKKATPIPTAVQDATIISAAESQGQAYEQRRAEALNARAQDEAAMQRITQENTAIKPPSLFEKIRAKFGL